MFRSGDLVVLKNSWDGYYAIVLRVTDAELNVFVSNGLTATIKLQDAEPLPINKYDTCTTANFREILMTNTA